MPIKAEAMEPEVAPTRGREKRAAFVKVNTSTPSVKGVEGGLLQRKNRISVHSGGPHDAREEAFNLTLVLFIHLLQHDNYP